MVKKKIKIVWWPKDWHECYSNSIIFVYKKSTAAAIWGYKNIVKVEIKEAESYDKGERNVRER